MEKVGKLDYRYNIKSIHVNLVFELDGKVYIAIITCLVTVTKYEFIKGLLFVYDKSF